MQNRGFYVAQAITTRTRSPSLRHKTGPNKSNPTGSGAMHKAAVRATHVSSVKLPIKVRPGSLAHDQDRLRTISDGLK